MNVISLKIDFGLIDPRWIINPRIGGGAARGDQDVKYSHSTLKFVQLTSAGVKTAGF
jgi:hypothetical protein